MVVRLNPEGSAVRLKDVARIELGALTYNQSGRFNGRPAALVAVFQAPGANALAVAEGVKATMEELKDRFPSDLDYAVGLDTTLPVTEGIKEIATTLVEAMLLVILVVFLFLQNWRATLIPLIAVPVSLIGTFAFFPLLGFSINTLSLFGLVLAIGLVVDDAIVVVEAVEHHIEEGLSPRDATLKAMSEVSGAGGRHRPRALVGVHPDRPHGRDPGPAQPAVRGDDRDLGAHLRLQRADACRRRSRAMLLRPRARVEGPARPLLRARSTAASRGPPHGYVSVSRGLVRKTALSLAILGRLRPRSRAASAGGCRPASSPRRTRASCS